MSGAIDVINTLITRVKRSQRISPDDQIVKVNLGSYLFVHDGWINVEGSLHALASKWPRALQKILFKHSSAREELNLEDYLRVLRTQRFVHHNLDFGLPFKNGSVDHVYASHVLEHFYPEIGEMLLVESYRVLKKGGRIRICVPDLKHAVDLYLSGDKKTALGYFFQDRKLGEFHRHKYMYDFELLEALLKKCGFLSIERLSYQKGKVPDLDKLDNRPEETLYVEAVK